MLVALEPVEGEVVAVESVVASGGHHAEEGAVEGVVVAGGGEEVVAGKGGVRFEFLGKVLVDGGLLLKLQGTDPGKTLQDFP